MDPLATSLKMASQKRRADARRDLKLAREGGGRAKQYKVCLVATALNDGGLADRRYRLTQTQRYTTRLTKQSTNLLFEIGSIRTTLWRTTVSVVMQTMEWIYSTRKKTTAGRTRNVSMTSVTSYVIGCSFVLQSKKSEEIIQTEGQTAPRARSDGCLQNGGL